MANTQTRKTQTPAEARAEAEQARLAAGQDAEQAKAKADEQAAAAQDKATASEQRKEVGSGKLVVLCNAFVARTSTEKGEERRTHRYVRGEVFNPVKGVHDVDQLIALKVLGKVGGKEPLRPVTALEMSQAAARYHQEDSPVLDLTAQPFEVQAPAETDD